MPSFRTVFAFARSMLIAAAAAAIAFVAATPIHGRPAQSASCHTMCSEWP